jgi:hypothetical protein
MPKMNKAALAKLNAEIAEAKKNETEADREYQRGYNALMLRAGYYALAHADIPGSWEKFAEASHDDLPETAAYLEGYEEAQDRMRREVGGCGFGFFTPRNQTAAIKRAKAA